jgi:uncharacterized protein with FMN-binding domain
MKKGLRTALIVVGIVVVVLGGLAAALWTAARPGMREVRALTVNPVDLSKVPDGTFQGTFTQGRFTFTVNVAMKDHKIAAILLSDPKQDNAVVKAIIDRVIAEQKVNVDTVSGASLTTRAFTKAVELALEKTQHAPGQ